MISNWTDVVETNYREKSNRRATTEPVKSTESDNFNEMISEF